MTLRQFRKHKMTTSEPVQLVVAEYSVTTTEGPDPAVRTEWVVTGTLVLYIFTGFSQTFPTSFAGPPPSFFGVWLAWP